jgi:hypothetical protein
MMGISSTRAARTIALTAAFAFATALVPATAAHAQLGGAVGVRIITNATESTRNTQRKGVEARVYYDYDFTPSTGLRAELAYVQMQFKRDVDTATFKVSENGFEVGAYLRREIRDGFAAGAYVTAGAVASAKFFCGSVGIWGPHGRVACDEGDHFLPGAVLGAGFRWPGNTSDFTFDLRWMQHTVAAGGGGLVSMSLGVRRRVQMRDDDR